MSDCGGCWRSRNRIGEAAVVVAVVVIVIVDAATDAVVSLLWTLVRESWNWLCDGIVKWAKKLRPKQFWKRRRATFFFFSCYDFKYVILVCFVFVRILLWLLFLRVCFISRLIGVDSLWSENNLWIFLFFVDIFLSVEFVSICHGIFYDLCDFCWKLTQICSNNLNNNNSNNSNNNKRRPQGKKSQQQLQWTGGTERERKR